MPSNVAALAAFTGGMPQVIPAQGVRDIPGTQGDPPLTPNPTASAYTKPYRNGTLPSPLVGGFSENPAYDGRTVDPGFSPGVQRAPLLGQGYYDQIPTGLDQPIDGAGTPNTRAKTLRQGLLTQLLGYQPDPSASAMSYVAALTGTVTPGNADSAISGVQS